LNNILHSLLKFIYQKMSKSVSKSSGISKRSSTSRKNNHVVSRIFHEDHLSGHKTPRLTTVVYVHNLKTGETSYGASLFREDVSNEVVDVFGTKQALRTALRFTAQKRLENKPVMIIIKKSKSIRDLHRQLRRAIGKHGVSS
jgi:hypothetical protein